MAELHILIASRKSPALEDGHETISKCCPLRLVLNMVVSLCTFLKASRAAISPRCPTLRLPLAFLPS